MIDGEAKLPRGRERDPLLHRTTVGDGYLLREKLGQGSLGFLYAAECRGQRVALKALRARWSAAAIQSTWNARCEAWNTAARAHGAVLLEVLAHGRDDRLAYLVQQRIDGEDLGSRIQRAKEGRRKGNTARSVPLPDERGFDEATRPFGSASAGDDARRIELIVRYFARVARALGALHARGFVHGNIKPSNLLVDAAGAPWLQDFACVGHAEAVLAGEVAGSIDTFAPEQIDGSRGACDARSDVFALAASCYQALVLELPFPGPLRHQTAQQILRARALPLQRHLAAIPRALSDLIARALSADPSARPADGTAFADALERALDAPPSSPRTPAWVLAVLACLILIPSTLPVAVLRGLVQERYQVSVFATSWFMSLQMIGAFLAAPLAGSLADRIERRHWLVVGALLLNAIMLLALSVAPNFAVLLCIRFCDGVTHIAALSVLMAIAADSATATMRGRTMGMLGAGLTLGVTIGASTGGVIGRDDPLRPLQLGALLSLVAACLACCTLRDTALRNVRVRLSDALSALSRERTLLAPLAFAFVDRFTVGFFTSVFPLWMRSVYQLPTPRIGMLLGAFLLPFALLSYPFGKLSERSSRVTLTCVGSVLYGCGTASLALWSPDLLLLPMMLLGVCSAVMFVPSLMLVTDLAPTQSKGAAMGAFNAAGSLGFICGPLVGGAVVYFIGEHAWGFGLAFVTAGLAELLCVLLSLPSLRRSVRAGRTT